MNTLRVCMDVYLCLDYGGKCNMCHVCVDLYVHTKYDMKKGKWWGHNQCCLLLFVFSWYEYQQINKKSENRKKTPEKSNQK